MLPPTDPKDVLQLSHAGGLNLCLWIICLPCRTSSVAERAVGPQALAAVHAEAAAPTPAAARPRTTSAAYKRTPVQVFGGMFCLSGIMGMWGSLRTILGYCMVRQWSMPGTAMFKLKVRPCLPSTGQTAVPDASGAHFCLEAEIMCGSLACGSLFQLAACLTLPELVYAVCVHLT